MIRVERASPQLLVDDVLAAARHCEERLGFTVPTQRESAS